MLLHKNFPHVQSSFKIHFFNQGKPFSQNLFNLAKTFKNLYSPIHKISTKYNIPDTMKKEVPNSLVRRWTKLVSFPLNEDSITLKEYYKKRENISSLSPLEKISNTPRESFYEATLHFSSNKDLQNKLQSFKSDIIRIDLLFDLLDCLAGLSSFSHCYSLDKNLNLKNAILVTAAVDHIHFYKPWLINKDLKIVSYPSWCGKSVIEIRMDLFQKQDNENEELVGNALFLMAARDIKSRNQKYVVPSLDFNGELDPESCKIRFEEGVKNQELRKVNSKNLSDLPPPTNNEILDMHEVFKLCEKKIPGKDFIYQEETKIFKTLMMHPQNQNLFGTIFGGFTIKEGVEIGMLAAYMYSNGEPFKIIKIDDFNFLSPIYVGSALQFESSVVFANEGIIQIMVIAWVITPKKEKYRSSVVYLTVESNKTDLLPVYPKTYAEALNYFDGKKKLLKFLGDKKKT